MSAMFLRITRSMQQDLRVGLAGTDWQESGLFKLVCSHIDEIWTQALLGKTLRSMMYLSL